MLIKRFAILLCCAGISLLVAYFLMVATSHYKSHCASCGWSGWILLASGQLLLVVQWIRTGATRRNANKQNNPERPDTDG